MDTDFRILGFQEAAKKMLLWAETEREAGLEDQVSETGFEPTCMRAERLEDMVIPRV